MRQSSSKKFWRNLDQYNETEAFKDSLSKEFPAPPQEQKVTQMERRDFLKVMGAGLLLASAACTRRPVEKVIPYVNKPEEISPGISNYYATTCLDGSEACGVLVRSREGRPLKIDGNEDYTLTEGATSARVQASLLDLYYPGRLKGPIKQNRGNLASKGLGAGSISWTQFDEEFLQKLKELDQQGKDIVILTGLNQSPSTKALLEEFSSQFSSVRVLSYDPSFPHEVAEAQELSYGQNFIPRYRFDKADFVLSFGADFLGTWLHPSEYSKSFSKTRRPDETKKMSQLVCVEAALSLTGTNADTYIPVKAGDELMIALSLAHEFVIERDKGTYFSDVQVRKTLAPYSMPVVSRLTGIPLSKLKSLAKDLWSNREKSLVVGGPLRGQNALALQIVVNFLNSILENDGVTVDWAVSHSLHTTSSDKEIYDLVQDMSASKVGALLMADGVNPVYNLPASFRFTEALKKVPLTLSFSNVLDETASLVDYVAPSGHYLENWGDLNPYRKIYTIVQPLIAPLYDTRSMQQSLLQWSGRSSETYYDYLRSYWKENIYRLTLSHPTFEIFWMDVLQKGIFDVQEKSSSKRIASPRVFSPQALSYVTQKPALKRDQFSLSLYTSVPLLDGRQASNAWLQELPQPLSQIVWDNYLSISPKTAAELGVSDGNIVRIDGKGFDSFEIPVHIQPKLHAKSLMLALGYGRKSLGEMPEDFGYPGGNLGQVGENVGFNAFPLQAYKDNQIQWTGLQVDSIQNTGKQYILATTQGHHTIEGRDFVKSTTFKEYQKDSHAGNHSHHHIMTIWPEYEYNGHRWGMAIDTNQCTGCSACIVGCQSENNIPVVGKEQVFKSREMHWIRVDRYYQGDTDNPDVVYQPMLCQHCENAPCETVCPVLATVHSEEGLNQMIYNRCVGTRYCANNCPYKVRRFNYFGYATAYEQKPLNLALNPDITTRSQGVMEKCTFCFQNIRTVKDKAKAEGRDVKANEVKTACQSACPTDAIIFGDLNNKKSDLVAKVKSHRSYHSLEELNVRPRVTYQLKLKNS